MQLAHSLLIIITNNPAFICLILPYHYYYLYFITNIQKKRSLNQLDNKKGLLFSKCVISDEKIDNIYPDNKLTD